MSDFAQRLVRIPGLPIRGLAVFLSEHTTCDAERCRYVSTALEAGIATVCTLRDGREIHLEWRAPFVIGTVLAASNATRESYLAAIGAACAGRFIPGGSVDVWLAPLPTEALAVVLLHPRGRWREILFAALGHVRARGRSASVQDFSRSSRAGIDTGYFAECCAIAWSTCRLARNWIEQGQPAEAQALIVGTTRWIHEWPSRLVRHFEPRLEALYREAEALAARHASDAVA